ncbi:hypothetical protein NEIRO03_2326 [Nematocida sp. AWRm78]|nr:hypothetical protein NEIRO03_2326 [Nematocida sp. AWRm78]
MCNKKCSVSVSNNSIYIMHGGIISIYSIENVKEITRNNPKIEFDKFMIINEHMYIIIGESVYYNTQCVKSNDQFIEQCIKSNEQCIKSNDQCIKSNEQCIKSNEQCVISNDQFKFIGNIQCNTYPDMYIYKDKLFLYKYDKVSGTISVYNDNTVSTLDITRSNPIFIIIDCVIYYINNFGLYQYDMTTRVTQEIISGSKLPKTEIFSLEKTEKYFIIGTSALLLIYCIQSNVLRRVTWHSSPVIFIRQVVGDLIISQGKNGNILLTDCDSLSNTFITVDYSLIRENFKGKSVINRKIFITKSGYIVIKTNTMINVINIPSKVCEYVYLLENSRKQVEISEIKEEKEKFLPNFNENPEKRFITKLDSKNFYIPESTVHHLDNALVFTTGSVIYRIMKELVSIEDFFYSNGHILIFITEDEEKSVITEKFLSKLSDKKTAKLYKLGKNNVERVFYGYVELDGMSITDMEVITGDKVILSLTDDQSQCTIRSYEYKDMTIYT